MDTYTTTVRVRRIMGFKDIRKGLIPLLLWPVLMMASLIIGVKVTPIAILAMIIIFFTIIPITIYFNKLTVPFRGGDSFEKKEVVFTVKEGKLYTDGIELDAEWNETDRSLVVDNVYLYKTFKHQRGTVVTRFAGVIEAPLADDFIRFLKDNNVEVLDSNSEKKDLI